VSSLERRLLDTRALVSTVRGREPGVAEIVSLRVQGIAWTHFEPPADVP
jgi:hypothetical protein